MLKECSKQTFSARDAWREIVTQAWEDREKAPWRRWIPSWNRHKTAMVSQVVRGINAEGMAEDTSLAAANLTLRHQEIDG